MRLFWEVASVRIRKEVEEMVNTKGQNLFYESTENRILCCKVRKVNPINRILPTLDGWITGIRKEHSKNRNSMQMFQIDEQHGGILKINPIIDWSLEQIMEQIRERQIPYNALLDQNYSSIGCAPCTRAIKPGIFSPLDGFLGQADFESVISSGKLVNGTSWTILLVLYDWSSTDAAKAKDAGSVLLRGPDMAAVLDVAKTFAYDKKHLSKGVCGTDDDKRSRRSKSKSNGRHTCCVPDFPTTIGRPVNLHLVLWLECMGRIQY